LFKIGELFALRTVKQAHVKNNQIAELWVQYVSLVRRWVI